MWQAKCDLGSFTRGLETSSKHTVYPGPENPCSPSLPTGRATGSQTHTVRQRADGWAQGTRYQTAKSGHSTRQLQKHAIIYWWHSKWNQIEKQQLVEGETLAPHLLQWSSENTIRQIWLLQDFGNTYSARYLLTSNMTPRTHYLTVRRPG